MGKEPDFEGVVDRTNGKTEGLFWRCTFSDVGHWDCTDKNRWFFAREQWWVACSTMAILSCSLWAVSIVATLPGMNCTGNWVIWTPAERGLTERPAALLSIGGNVGLC